jgi:asparagine synthase (glutamine-hydrolysing)
MCGIALIIGKNAKSKSEDMANMIYSISHRGEITEKFLKSDLLAYVRRLKIIDRENATQPVFNIDKSKCIVFNGEIFNHQLLRIELREEYSFQTQSDTELVLAAYEKWGRNCLSHFIGQYAFAIVDIKKNTVIMARDEIGIVPLYYAKHEDLLYIASEIKSLIFLNKTIYTVPPGSFIDENQIIHSFYTPLHEIKYSNSNLFIKKLRTTICESVKERVDTDLPIGIIYSGGLDSTIILSESLKYHSNVTAYTIGSENSEDFRISKQFCKEMKIKQVVIKLDKNSFKITDIENAILVSELTEYGDIINAVITIRLFKQIHQDGIKIVLCGDGSDELFGGYSMYSKADNEKYHKLFNYKLLNLNRTELQRVDRCSMAFSVETRVPFLDKRLLEMSVSIPSSWKIKDGIEKWCIRQAFKNDLPDYIINRKKNPLSHSSGLHEWVRLYKFRFGKIHKKFRYYLNEPLHKDFSFLLKENGYDVEKAIKEAKHLHDYTKKYLLIEYLKSKIHKIIG